MSQVVVVPLSTFSAWRTAATLLAASDQTIRELVHRDRITPTACLERPNGISSCVAWIVGAETGKGRRYCFVA